MAIITRRYVYAGPWLLDLQHATDPGLALLPTNFRIYRDVVFNDADVSIAAHDERMQRYGYYPDVEGTTFMPNGTAIPFFGLRSPDGSIWEIQVDNAGVLTTVKRTP